MSRLDKVGRLPKFLQTLPERLARQYRWHRPVQGLPGGLEPEVAERLCLAHLGAPLRRASHVHLSGWKRTGAYRLILQSGSGRTWRAIYKDAVYDLDQIPALQDLPVRPGPPEYWIYRCPSQALSPYLPAIYLCQEIVPGRHYRYVLEDLSQVYQRLSEYRITAWKCGLLSAASVLSTLHQALDEWFAAVDEAHLLRFDRNFSLALLPYARNNLARYVQITADESVGELLQVWPQICAFFSRSEFHEQQARCPIHGDYHAGNIYVHAQDPQRIKLVDWEWAGVGRPHADLTSLLKRQDPDVEQQALLRFAERNRHLSLAEHRRLYEWCQLERGLLDAAFLAGQQIASPGAFTWIPPYIQTSARRALCAQEQLREGGGR